MVSGPKDAGGGDDGDGLRLGVRALVLVPVLTRLQDRRDADGGVRRRLSRSPEARLEEACGLVQAIDQEIVHAEIVTVAQPRPATLFGTGRIEGFAQIVREKGAELVVVDHPLTPVQQRNLEREFGAKVLDRTGLILEIFGRRARTKEGVLQVELAHLEYQRGRLVRSWTHLERQRGGAGFLGGPGETQIEADRRILQDKITKIRRELETVRRTRDLHRAKRKKVPYPVVAIVGYTNAGKSTLFNRLTGASVMAEDMLFATLDPTLRRVRLPHGAIIILSDTVGFISDLPTHLVAAFRATLEEVVEADLVIHLRDISDPDTVAQAEDVEEILSGLGVDPGDRRRVLEVWNKIDNLDDADRARLAEDTQSLPAANRPIAVSAITGEGTDALMAAIETHISGTLRALSVTLSADQMPLIDWVYRHATVTQRTDHEDGGVSLDLQAPQAAADEILERIHGRRAREAWED